MSAVTLTDVLREARPGRVRRIPTTREQRRRLGPEGLRALDVARHLLGARDALGARGRFPLTEHAAQALARKLGTPIGQKRARSVPKLLSEARVIEEAGSYRQRRGTRYRVALWRLVRSAAGRGLARVARGRASALRVV